MTSKAVILQHIAKLEQDILLLKSMVLSLEDTETSNLTPSVLSNTKDTTPLTMGDSPEELVARFLVAAQQQNIADRDLFLSKLVHSSILKHAPAVDSFLRFSFKTLQKRWSDYLSDITDPHSFQVVRQQRNDRGELSDLRIYLKADHRSPCPITFQQDPVNDMEWRVISSSL
jgi:hypothetical protein